MWRKQVAYWLLIGGSVASLVIFMVGWARAVDYERLGVDRAEVVNAGTGLRAHSGCEQECDVEALSMCIQSRAVCDMYMDICAMTGEPDKSGYVECMYATEECERSHERCMMLCKRVR